MKKILLLIFISFLFLQINLLGQDRYDTALGIRGGNMIGVTYKKMVIVPSWVAEGVFGFEYYDRSVDLVALFEYHKYVTYLVNFYAGIGFTTGYGKTLKFKFCGDVIIGAEYTFRNYPINFSLDYKPGFNVTKKEFYFDEFGVSARYILR